MNAMNYSTVRKELAKTMEQVCSDHEPTIITKGNKCSVVMISLDDYRSMEETAYLLSSPRNAARLAKSIEDIGNGNVKTMTMKELERAVANAKSNVLS